MTPARAIEYRITRNLVNHRAQPIPDSGLQLARRLICAASLAGGMLLFGSMMPELLGALLAAGALAGLAGDSSRNK